jgi:hypothetical protein
MQSLDVICFQPVKHYYRKVIVVTRSGLIREGTRLSQCVQSNAIMYSKLRLMGVEN